MKKLIHILPLCLLLIKSAAAQQVKEHPLLISDQKTISIIFPYSIKMVDRGSNFILTQKVTEVPSILKVKAASPDLKETNLTVLTADGKLYSFLVSYKADIVGSVLDLRKRDTSVVTSEVQLGSFNEKEVYETCRKIQQIEAHLKRSISNKGLKAGIKGAYAKGDVLYFKLELLNNSVHPLKPFLLRFYLEDKKSFRTTPIQEQVLKPIYQLTSSDSLNTQQKICYVVAFERFSVPPGKRLIIEFIDDSGSIMLGLKLNERMIRNADPFD